MFFVHGWDPRGADHYYRLYQSEAAKQATLLGRAIEVGPQVKKESGATSWRITADHSGFHTETTYEFLGWDHVVRGHWIAGRWRMVGVVAWAFMSQLLCGQLFKVLALSRHFFYVQCFAFAVLFAIFVVAALGAAAAAAAVLGFGGSGWLALAAAAVAAAGLLAAGFALERRLVVFWMARGSRFSIRRARQWPDDYGEWVSTSGERIVARVRQGGVDEILIVGHSMGSETALEALAAALQLDPDLTGRGPTVSFLTLGTTVPMQGLLPAAERFRASVLSVATTPGLEWVDVSAPPDPACFALVDPVIGLGQVRPPHAPVRPKLLSARFARIFTPETYAKVRRRWFDIHFMYLMAAEIEGDYDYFAVTAGPLTLADRFNHLKSVDDFTKLRGFAA